jgi:hypothetical protein
MMENMADRIARLEAAQRQQQEQARQLAVHLRLWRGAAAGLLALGLAGGALALSPPLAAQEIGAAGLGNDLSNLRRRLAAVERRLAQHHLVVSHFTVGPPAGSRRGAGDLPSGEVTFTGNLHIVNGLGSTGTTNGMGNLIVGYNEIGPQPFPRSGSHNVVVGSNHGWESFGGLVAGQGNLISGAYASVSGGSDNTASGDWSSVSGGAQNTAGGTWSSVSAGSGNTAAGDYTSVSGGTNNTAGGNWSSVGGGALRSAPNLYNWAAGGLLQDW